MANPFGDVPSGAKIPPKPFQLNIPREKLEELSVLVSISKVSPPTYENSQEDRKYGITRDWLLHARQDWKDFDWRPTENRINSFPQFTYEIEGMTIHFVGLFSKKADAVPIVLLHGWPGSFLEFLPLLSLLRDKYSPEELPFHVVVPSLPGFTLSSGPPLDKNFTGGDTARVVDQVMVNLGFEGGYVAQGGDIGSKIGRILAVDHDACKAVHLNACYMNKPDNVEDSAISELEKQNLARGEWFFTYGHAYAIEHGTRTSTIGHVLSANPVALLSWIGEKFLDWPDEPLPVHDILESVSLYWLTDTFPRCIYHYREQVPLPKVQHAQDPRWYIKKPFGFSYFPKELVPIPRAWVETTGNLVFWNSHEKGGHFAAFEQPAELLEDLGAFVEKVRADIK
ncbi:epoxide hydrolase family protein [Aspergillus saccharolyticus JOP 1030-1]|uniref:Alpha/beta-hydrolase n=1 Tax=Aspergillus saccharolyticus JOP 1030-1 TaxID=1450539 RepID=A0A318ZDI6_9EURO|nr:alpha/beta-hydrolase [Aspergillus saccharolyticus JOP 1030-1]PYH45409.1 alpha/beta-hydrolase [Aspergillus saccharolyticus JOP 1030-1]